LAHVHARAGAADLGLADVGRHGAGLLGGAAVGAVAALVEIDAAVGAVHADAAFLVGQARQELTLLQRHVRDALLVGAGGAVLDDHQGVGAEVQLVAAVEGDLAGRVEARTHAEALLQLLVEHGLSPVLRGRLLGLHDLADPADPGQGRLGAHPQLRAAVLGVGVGRLGGVQEPREARAEHADTRGAHALLEQLALHQLGARARQRDVLLGGAQAVGVADHQDLAVGRAGQLGHRLLELALGLGCELVGAGLEADRAHQLLVLLLVCQVELGLRERGRGDR
jgi:hypothetical protein